MIITKYLLIIDVKIQNKINSFTDLLFNITII